MGEPTLSGDLKEGHRGSQVLGSEQREQERVQVKAWVSDREAKLSKGARHGFGGPGRCGNRRGCKQKLRWTGDISPELEGDTG